MKKINRNNIEMHLIEKQFNLLELTALDALFHHDWREKWTLTQEQQNTFKAYSIPLIKKTLKCSKSRAEVALDRFLNMYGLKIK